LGVKLEDVREEVLEFLGAPQGEQEGGGEEKEGPAGQQGGEEAEGEAGAKGGKGKTPALNAFGRDLTKLARQNHLDPVIGRQDEIERVIQILSRRTKNNPVLLGEAGPGKTANRGGLPQKHAARGVPAAPRNKTAGRRG